MKNMKTNIFLFAMLAASPLMVNAQTADDADSVVAKKKVHVAFRDVDADHLLGGVSYVDMEELRKKDYTMGSLEDLNGLVGGWNGNNLWGMDNDRLDNNDNSNTPLVIVDGVKRPANNVLPSEIEQITFLKGAQAVVLYGAKGAKGAIVITTKRGKVDGLKIEATANTGWYVAKEFPEYLGSAEYMTLYNEARANDGLDPRYTQQDIYNHASGINPYRYPNVNYYSDEYIRKAYNRSEGTLEIQGGGQRAHFYTHINYYRAEDLLNFGPAKDNYTDRFSVRGNVDLVINKVVKGFANVSASFYSAHQNKGDFWGDAATMRPNFPENAAPLIDINMVDPNASKALATLGKSLNLLDGRYFPGGTKITQTNAIADCYFGGKTQSVSRQFQFDAGIIYDMNKFVKGLSFKTLFSIDYAGYYSLSYANKYAVFIPTWSNYNTQDAIVGLYQQNDEIVSGHMQIDDDSKKFRQTITWNGHFDYDHTFADKHHVTGLLLASMYTTVASGTYHRYANANLGLQAGYDYMGRYFADISLAGVHSARLAEGNREALSHSFTLGWNIAKEKFLQGSFVDDFLISASYSNLSEDIDVYLNSDTNNWYLYKATWSNSGSGFSWNEGVSTNHTTPSQGTNPALDFIHRKEFALSLRASFFNKLISTELTYFNTDMDGFIVQNLSNFPSHLKGGLGSFMPAINNNIQNRKGLDFSVKMQKQFGKVHAALGVVGTYLKTEWKEYDELIDPLAPHKYTEGHPLDAIWGYKCLGFYTEDDFNYNAETGKYTLKDGLPKSKLGGSIQPGDLKYEDVAGGPDGGPDGTIDSHDMVELGKSGTYGAPLTLGLNLTLKYKNWTFFMVGSGQFGAYALKNNNYYFANGDNKYSVFARDRWTPETAATATHPRLTTLNAGNNSAASTFWLYKTDRFDIRKVQLTYDFPEEMMGSVVKALSVYVSGNDLLTISGERKLMETSIGYAPQTRFYNIGAKVTF